MLSRLKIDHRYYCSNLTEYIKLILLTFSKQFPGSLLTLSNKLYGLSCEIMSS